MSNTGGKLERLYRQKLAHNIKKAIKTKKKKKKKKRYELLEKFAKVDIIFIEIVCWR